MKLRQKLYLTVLLLIFTILLGAVAIQSGVRKSFLVFRDALELPAVTVDGRTLTLQDMAFYIAYEEQQIEEKAFIYNPASTREYWNLYTNYTYIRDKGKQTVMDMAIHDEIFYQMALEEGVELSGEEERHLANTQYDFWSDLGEQQREELGVSEDVLRESMRKIAIAEKYQYLLAAMEDGAFEEYSVTGETYGELLKTHLYEVEKSVWDRVHFGEITLKH
ncbi:MAG: hypothetical protein ACLT3H_13750 [Roseburia sp.]